jgi:acyl carrier protein
MTRNEISQVVISTFNQVIVDNEKTFMGLANENTLIMGVDSPFDSIDLVSFIVALEQTLEDEWSISLTLADERAMSQVDSPFKSIGSIIDYIEVLKNEL